MAAAQGRSATVSGKDLAPGTGEGRVADLSISWWLTLGGAEAERLQDLIARHSKSLEAPLFPPHVTLLSGVRLAEGDARMRDLLHSTFQLAQEIGPMNLVCQEVKGFEQWNQCLLLTVGLTDELASANVRAQQLLKPAPPDVAAAPAAAFAPPVRLPHVSVAYTDFPGDDDRAAAIQRVEDSDPWVKGFAFTACTLSMWQTSGGLQGVPTWRKLADFPLAGSRKRKAPV